MSTATTLTLVASFPLVAAWCPPPGQPDIDTELAARQSWARGPVDPPPSAAAGQSTSVVGRWDPPQPWPVIGIHGMVLSDGWVLHYSYPSQTSGSRARKWNPQTGQFIDVSMSTDIFCSGHSMLPDGTVFISGGNDYDCQFQGRTNTFVFDPVMLTWTPDDDMFDGRWYPTHTTLGDGRVLITSGLALDCDLNADMEMYTPGEGLTFIDEGHQYLDLYPRLHLLSNGDVAFVGPSTSTRTFQLGVGWTSVTNTIFGGRWDGTSILVPGFTDRVMILGGQDHNGTKSSCEFIDFQSEDPQWTPAPSMHHARRHFDALLLPDGTVFVMGGGLTDLYLDPQHTPELFDPATNQWIELPPHSYGRMYHSTTLLLPDGRVLITGQDNGDSAYWGEVYQPPYLFRGPRPVIGDAPDAVVHGQTFTIESANAAAIDEVVLMRLSSNTHSVNFEQRHVPLQFELLGGDLSATVPSNPNLAPPGTYMLFILNGSGVPSVSTMVRVLPPDAADVNRDCRVDTDDLLLVLNDWGSTTPGAPTDVDGSGVVDADDILFLVNRWGPCGL